MLLKAFCRWSGAAAIIPTKMVSAGSARVGACRVANALSAMRRDWPISTIRAVCSRCRKSIKMMRNRYCSKANRSGSAKIRTSSRLKCGCCRYRCWRVCPSSAKRSGPAVRYEYNSSGDLVRVIGRDGNVKRSFGYKNNLMVSHTDAAGLVSEYEYDHYTPTGKVLRNWTSMGEEWRFTYHDGYTEVTDVLGRTEQYYYDYNTELIKRVFANGSTNLVECDKLRRGIYKTQSKFVIRYEFGLFCRLKSRVGLLEFAQLFRFFRL